MPPHAHRASLLAASLAALAACPGGGGGTGETGTATSTGGTTATTAPHDASTTGGPTATGDPTSATTDAPATTGTAAPTSTGDAPTTCAALALAAGHPTAVCETAGAAICGGEGPATSDCDHCCTKPVTGSYWIDAGTHFPATGKGSYATAQVPVMGSLLGVPESAVYHRSLVHTQDEYTGWELRLGKGSQIYAIHTSRGQLIGAQVPNGVWIDRVLMTVAVAGAKNTAELPYFIHQAGTYMDANQGMTMPYWSPMLGVQDDAAASTYRTLVWPQQAHVYAPIPWRSDVLLQQHVRDVGDGIVEITYVYTNFGDDTLDFLNLPWSGFARNALPVYAESTPDLGWTWVTITNWLDHLVPYLDTGGWTAMVEQQAPDSFALGVVFGPGPQASTDGQVVRYGPNGGEDLTVFEAIPGATIGPGETYLFRYHLVFGRLSPAVHPHGNALTAHTGGVTLAFALADAGLLDPCALAAEAPACTFYTLDRPVAGARPLLLLRDKTTAGLVLSSDPYALSAKPYLGTSTDYLAFLGWGVRDVDDAPAALGMVRLSSLLDDPAVYPDPAAGRDLWVFPRLP